MGSQAVMRNAVPFMQYRICCHIHSALLGPVSSFVPKALLSCVRCRGFKDYSSSVTVLEKIPEDSGFNHG